MHDTNLENKLAPVVQAALNEEVTKRTVGAVLSALVLRTWS